MPLVASNLGITYSTLGGDVVVLENVNLSVGAGEFVAVIGPSGCGKSTLLHSLGAMLTPSSGSLSFDGVPLTKPNPNRASFVFQEYSLLPWKTAVENVALGLRFAKVGRAERHERAMASLNLVGLANSERRYPHELSGGMQQRVAVARAMVMNPDVLLMDEPFGALDEQSRRQLGFSMSGLLTEQKKSVVMITHSLDEAVFWADRILIMSPRPARIVMEIEVKQPRPRELLFTATPEFAEIRIELFKVLVALTDGNVESTGAVDAVETVSENL